jgi:hypothetical protein
MQTAQDIRTEREKEAAMKEIVKRMRVEIEAALETVGARNGMSITAGNATYDGDGFRIKVEARLVGAASKDAKTYDLYRDMYRLPLLGARFSLGGRTYETIGLRTKNRKKPILVRREDNGKEYKISLDMLRRAMVGDVDLP